jgi:hypothetical protein
MMADTAIRGGKAASRPAIKKNIKLVKLFKSLTTFALSKDKNV